MGELHRLDFRCPGCGVSVSPPLPERCPSCGEAMPRAMQESLAPPRPLRGPRLLGRWPGGSPFEFLLRETTRVGRNPDSDLRLEDREVSKEHLILEVSGEQVVLRDLGSANGTLLNGSRVREQALTHGDQIVLGATRLYFLSRPEPSGPLAQQLETFECQPRLELPAVGPGTPLPAEWNQVFARLQTAARLHSHLAEANTAQLALERLVKGVAAVFRPTLVGVHSVAERMPAVRQLGAPREGDLAAVHAAVQKVLESGVAHRADDCLLPAGDPSAVLEAPIRSLVAVPVCRRGERLGVLYCLGWDVRYSATDEAMLSGLAAHAATALG